MNRLSAEETVQAVKSVYNILKMLHEDGALAGIVLTNQSFDHVKRLFGDAAIKYKPAELDLDPEMKDTFVVDGLLIMRGTQLQ